MSIYKIKIEFRHRKFNKYKTNYSGVTYYFFREIINDKDDSIHYNYLYQYTEIEKICFYPRYGRKKSIYEQKIKNIPDELKIREKILNNNEFIEIKSKKNSENVKVINKNNKELKKFNEYIKNKKIEVSSLERYITGVDNNGEKSTKVDSQDFSFYGENLITNFDKSKNMDIFFVKFFQLAFYKEKINNFDISMEEVEDINFSDFILKLNENKNSFSLLMLYVFNFSNLITEENKQLYSKKERYLLEDIKKSIDLRSSQLFNLKRIEKILFKYKSKHFINFLFSHENNEEYKYLNIDDILIDYEFLIFFNTIGSINSKKKIFFDSEIELTDKLSEVLNNDIIKTWKF